MNKEAQNGKIEEMQTLEKKMVHELLYKNLRKDIDGYLQSNIKQMDRLNATRQDLLQRNALKPMKLITKKRS